MCIRDRTNKAVQQAIHIPELARDILEQIGFEARKSEYVDSKSGVSARMSITAFENLMSAAERRMLMSGEQNTSIRMSDFLGIIPAINGKVELVYEGEQEGAEQISFHLINQAVKTLFPTYFPDINKLEKQDEEGPYDLLLGWFYGDNELFLEDNLPENVYQDTLMNVPNLKKLIATHQAGVDTTLVAIKNLVFSKRHAERFDTQVTRGSPSRFVSTNSMFLANTSLVT